MAKKIKRVQIPITNLFDQRVSFVFSLRKTNDKEMPYTLRVSTPNDSFTLPLTKEEKKDLQEMLRL